MDSSKKKIAIIGAGAAGLTSIKGCKEEGLEPTCFEKTACIGGLWCYRGKSVPGVASVMESTIMNTSKDMSAFSDFPPPDNFPNFMHHSLVHKYFELYADHFDLRRHVKLDCEVVSVTPAEDFLDTGKWLVRTRSTQDQVTEETEFHGVMVCTGHHSVPVIPDFQGMDKFQGDVIHSHDLLTVDALRNKTVVVVGLGNSGGDAAVEIASAGGKVYLSTRRGSWLIPRVANQGRPFDTIFTRRSGAFMMKILPPEYVSSLMEKELETTIDYTMYGLKPTHRFISQHPTCSDTLPSMLICGRITIKGDIDRFSEKGVVFAGEHHVTEIDAVVLATGYNISFPFISEDIIAVKDNIVPLYKNVFPPNLEHPTLAMIGVIQPSGCLFPAFELQARWYAMLMNRKLRLPSKYQMMEDIKLRREARKVRYIQSARHTIEEDWITYMDTIAEIIGARPNLLTMALTDPKLFWACFAGPCFPFQYRLTGPHSWSGARKAILTWEERMKSPLKTLRLSKKPVTYSRLFWGFRLMILISLFAAVWNIFI